MMNYYWGNNYSFGNMMGFGSPLAPFFPLMLLDLVLKGFALYKSARKGETYWFIALLVVNSMGFLPVIYLWLNRDQKVKTTSTKSKSKKK